MSGYITDSRVIATQNGAMYHYEILYTYRSQGGNIKPVPRDKQGNRLYTMIDWANPYIDIAFYTYEKQYMDHYYYKYVNGRKTRIKTTIFKKVKTPNFRVMYDKVTHTESIWCLKIKLGLKHYNAGLLSDKEVIYFLYAQKMLFLSCKKLNGYKPAVVRTEMHACTNKQIRGIPMPEEPLISADAIEGGPCFNVRSLYSYASNPRILALGRYVLGNDDVHKFLDYEEGETPYSFWNAKLQDLVNESWPSIENSSTITNATELLIEGLPIAPVKWKAGDKTPLRNIASSEWLRLNFGVVPLIAGAYDIARVAFNMEHAVSFWNKSFIQDKWIDGQSFKVYSNVEQINEYGPHILGTEFNAQSSVINDAYGSHTDFSISAVYTNYEGHLKTRYKANYVSSIQQISLLANLLSNDIRGIVHELVPFTWFFDYFSNAQSSLNALNNRTFVPTTKVQVVYSHHQNIEYAMTCVGYSGCTHYMRKPNPWTAPQLGCYPWNYVPVMVEVPTMYESREDYFRYVREYNSIPAHSGDPMWLSKPQSGLKAGQYMNIAAVVNLLGDKWFR